MRDFGRFYAKFLFVNHPRNNQGSHGDWKTGKTGKMKMVREKSGKSQGESKNDQKSGNFVKSQGILPDVSKITDTQIMGYKPLNMCSP